MSSQYSAASLHRSKEPARRRIKAPELDTSALIRDNALTLIGRVLNPAEQRVELLLSALPLLWSLKGKVFGSDLGRNCFQFRFELEDDLTEVLANRPYQFCRWMLAPAVGTYHLYNFSLSNPFLDSPSWSTSALLAREDDLQYRPRSWYSGGLQNHKDCC